MAKFSKMLLLTMAMLVIVNAQVTLNLKDDGYRGIWYMNEPSNDVYVYKYSGGLGTYCAKHQPFAVYCKEVNKTFFCYGGTSKTSYTQLLHMVSYYDHATGSVPRPTIVLNKQTDDAHDNPVISVDDSGYIWLFSTSHGTSRTSYIHKSTTPYNVDEFVRIYATRMEDTTAVSLNNFSYMQIWHDSAKGFFSFFTRYYCPVFRTPGYITSQNGVQWSEWKPMAIMGQGSYQISVTNKNKIGTAFDYHPSGGVNYRTNLYYLETPDRGATWRTADGQAVTLPLSQINNTALIHDYESEGLLVYIKDIRFDSNDNPIILYLTSKGYESGPENDPRTWTTARWTGTTWDIKPAFTSGNNYDMGSLYLLNDSTWKIIGPTEMGPQPYNPGGEIALWTTSDRGNTWVKTKQLTSGSPRNHTFVRRPVNADSAFWGLWADGHGRMPSTSYLYFCDMHGNVRLLPPNGMTTDNVVPGIFTGFNLMRIDLLPEHVLMSTNHTYQLKAIGFYSDGSSLEIKDSLVWFVRSPGIITVNDSGKVTAFSETGTQTVVCSLTTSGIKDSCIIDVVDTISCYFDDFDRVPKLSWTPLHSSYWSIDSDSGNYAYHLNNTDYVANGAKPGEYSLLNDVTVKDFELEVRARSTEVASNALADYVVIFGYEDPDNYYCLLAHGERGAIYKYTNGIRDTLVTIDEPLITDRTYDTLKIISLDNVITVFRNGIQKCAIAETISVAGQVGLGSFNDGAYFDGFTLTPLSPGMAINKKIMGEIPFSMDVRPNPFNPTVTLFVRLPTGSGRHEASLPEVAVYDVNGKLIKKLGPLNAESRTSYEYMWDAKNTPSGLYIAHVRRGDKTLEKKLVLLK